MNVKNIMLGVVLTLFAVPVLAFHCPTDMKKIDAALAANPSLSPAQLGEVGQLRAQGEQDHRGGNHRQSVAVLGRAMQILNIQ